MFAFRMLDAQFEILRLEIMKTDRMFTSKRPLKVQISQGLGPVSQIELLKTGRKSNSQGCISSLLTGFGVAKRFARCIPVELRLSV